MSFMPIYKKAPLVSRPALLILLLALLVFPAALAGAQGDPDAPEVTVTFDPDNFAIGHGEQLSEWDGRFTDPGAVTFHDGQFHMLRNGFQGWPESVQIGYLTSEDGLTWTEVTAEPVLTTDEVPFADVAALASSVHVQEDGTWVLYFYTWGRPRVSEPISWSIGRATAADPLGPWAVDETPVLLPGDEGSWDAAQVYAPSVVVTDEGYWMYYAGVEEFGTGIQRIGLATSTDGIEWTRYDDPDTTEAPFAVSDPVLLPASSDDTGGDDGNDAAGPAWDANFVHQPRVTQAEDGLVMLYRSANASGADRAYGLATSQDGITWTRYAGNPVVHERDALRRGMWFSELVYHDGLYYMYLEMFRGYQSETDIYALTLEGDLFE